jgi:dienelactone hydrolase
VDRPPIAVTAIPLPAPATRALSASAVRRRLPVLALAAFACAACGGSHGARLEASPHDSLLDRPVAIRLDGVRPGTRVTVSLRENGWSSRAVYRADAHGVVDLAHAASSGGSYTGVHPMGLFWSLRGSSAPSPWDGGTVEIEATEGAKRLARTSIVRRAGAAGETSRTLSVAHDGLYGRYFAPPRDGRRHPAVLIFGGSEGGLSVEPDARLLAAHGFPTLALAYFAEPGLPSELGRVPLEYFARALRFLDRQPGVDPGRVVTYGESRGSEAALELGVHYPALVHGVVGIVPSAEVNAGLVTHGAGRVPAWTFRGRALPFTGLEASIPVERIRGPILVAGGKDDLVWPSYYFAEDIADRSRARHGPPVHVHEYADAGHFGYAVPYLPSGDAVFRAGVRYPLGGTAAGNAAARADLWPRILAFLGGVPEAGR